MQIKKFGIDIDYKMVDDKILDKIAKLKALSTSDNENEAMRSLEAMRKYMEKYNISEDMLQKLNKNECSVDSYLWKRPDMKSMRKWEINLSSVIATLFDCRIIINSRMKTTFHKTKRTGILFIGLEDDRLIASEMYDYVRKVIHNEALKHLVIEKKEFEGVFEDNERGNTNLKFNSRAFINSFQIGCTNRIALRVNEIIENRRKNYEHEQNSTALIIIDTKLQKVDDYIDDMKCGKFDSSTTISSMVGYEKGKEVGGKISLENQITEKRNDLGQKLIN